MYQTDYLMRIIQQAGMLLRAMRNALAGDRPDEATDLSQEALQLILGVQPGLVEQLTVDGLIALLSVGGEVDPTRARLAAEVYVRRAQAAALRDDHAAAAPDIEKAAKLIEVVLASGRLEDATDATQLLEELRAVRAGGETSA